jgi:uncharacterized iron-regulated membrane protein
MTTFTAEPRQGGLIICVVVLSLTVIGLSAGWFFDHVTLSGKITRLETEIDHWLSTDVAKERLAAEKLQTEVGSLKAKLETLTLRQQASASQ